MLAGFSLDSATGDQFPADLAHACLCTQFLLAACSKTADAATAEAEGEEDSDCEGETDSLSTKGSSGELKFDDGNLGAPVFRGELPTS